MTVDSAYFIEAHAVAKLDPTYFIDYESIGPTTFESWITYYVDDIPTSRPVPPEEYTVTYGGKEPIFQRGRVDILDTEVTFPGEDITLYFLRKTPIIQELDLIPYTPTPTESVEFGLDRLTFILQEIEGNKCGGCWWGGTVDDPSPPVPEPPVEQVCVQWVVDETSVDPVIVFTGTYGVSPTQFDSRVDAHNLITNNGNEVWVFESVGSGNPATYYRPWQAHISTDGAESWVTKAQQQVQNVDVIWASNEKTTSGTGGTVLFSGTWDYQTPATQSAPGVGEVIQSVDVPTDFLISEIDLGGINRAGNLSALVQGDDITLDGQRRTIHSVTDSGSYYTLELAALSTIMASPNIYIIKFNEEPSVPGVEWEDARWPGNQVKNENWGANSVRWLNGELICTFLGYDGYGVTGAGSYIQNLSTGAIVQTGWNFDADAELEAYKETYYGYGTSGTRNLFTMSWWGGQLTTLAKSTSTVLFDPYTLRPILCIGGSGYGGEGQDGIIYGNSAQLTNIEADGEASEGAASVLNVINGELHAFGTWNTSGNTATNNYVRILPSVITDDPYIATQLWDGSAWLRSGAEASDQPNLNGPGTPEWTRRIRDIGAGYPDRTNIRPVNWVAGQPVYKEYLYSWDRERYGYMFSTLTDAVIYDYNPDKFWPTAYSFDVFPIESKGAFVSVEVYNVNLTSCKLMISATGEPGSFSERVDFVLPVAHSTGNTGSELLYTGTHFLYCWRGTDALIYVIKFADPFTCALYQDV